MKSALIQSTIPILVSLNLDETAAFYTVTLGFKQMARHDDYLIVGRDGCELHFFLSDNRMLAENTACYVRTPDADALHRDFAARGAKLKPPEVRPWGMKELYVIDPHGNLLKFGEHA